MIMSNTHKLAECADMTEEKFLECIERVDLESFIKNPTQALVDAGITLKKGVSLKFVENEEEAKALPANVIPLKLRHVKKNDENLPTEDLDKVVGGATFSNEVLGGRTLPAGSENWTSKQAGDFILGTTGYADTSTPVWTYGTPVQGG
jgi:hypothetical protein